MTPRWHAASAGLAPTGVQLAEKDHALISCFHPLPHGDLRFDLGGNTAGEGGMQELGWMMDERLGEEMQ